MGGEGKVVFKRGLSSDFSWISRSFRSLIISINRPLNIEERHTAT
jgi:hypothetical protein